ncbi:MAG: LPXTG cell wall anchor domain-containing protein [Clostridia bacterium]|nr:LPXTG cell wall anchor domain-containing protein [Clostridia bacterium]
MAEPDKTIPATGESMVLVISAIALMMLAAYGGVYAILRRRTADGQAD